MVESNSETENRILEAAKMVFFSKGLDGARMQEIADEAGINKALLHYYFRSKDKLFEAIFAATFTQFFPKVDQLTLSNRTLKEKLSEFIDIYIQLLRDNPQLPMFVVREINRDPEAILILMQRNLPGKNILEIFHQFAAQMQSECNMTQAEALHTLINIISMCVFPFIGRPLLKQMFFKQDNNRFEEFISQRKDIIKKTIFSTLGW